MCKYMYIRSKPYGHHTVVSLQTFKSGHAISFTVCYDNDDARLIFRTWGKVVDIENDNQFFPPLTPSTIKWIGLLVRTRN